MKFYKISLVITLILILMAGVFAVYIWAKLQTFQTQSTPVGMSDSEVLKEQSANEESSESTLVSGQSQSATGAETEPIVIRRSQLSDSQAKTLDMLGIEGEEIVITVQMQLCAEGKLGAGRLNEIIAGDSPSVIELAQLSSCL